MRIYCQKCGSSKVNSGYICEVCGYDNQPKNDKTSGKPNGYSRSSAGDYSTAPEVHIKFKNGSEIIINSVSCKNVMTGEEMIHNMGIIDYSIWASKPIE